MNKIESFHPKVIICDHFDATKNKVDIIIETLLAKINLSEDLTNVLNELRRDQIDKINEIREINLNHVKFDEDQFRIEWKHVLSDDCLLDYNQKVEMIKEKFISIDCILVADPSIKCKISLFITPWFNNENNLKFLKFV